MNIPTINDLHTAAKRIANHCHRTPVLTNHSIDAITHSELYFKCENFQKVGAFKYRGACNRIFSLSNEIAQNGVATHSSGNHGAAIARAARERGIKAYVVMPENAPQVKKDAVAAYGAEILFCKSTLESRQSTLQQVVDETGALFISPYDDPGVIAGQGTTALELMEQVNDLDILLAPVGGGGLISGSAIAATHHSRKILTVGAEPRNVDDAYRSFKSHKLQGLEQNNTICDGLRTTLGKLNFEIILKHADEILTASEENIILALKLIWQRMKIVVEPSAAVTLAVILEHPDFFYNKKCGLILSGGNVDFSAILPYFS